MLVIPAPSRGRVHQPLLSVDTGGFLHVIVLTSAVGPGRGRPRERGPTHPWAASDFCASCWRLGGALMQRVPAETNSIQLAGKVSMGQDLHMINAHILFYFRS